jgi:hypothetical protein
MTPIHILCHGIDEGALEALLDDGFTRSDDTLRGFVTEPGQAWGTWVRVPPGNIFGEDEEEDEEIASYPRSICLGGRSPNRLASLIAGMAAQHGPILLLRNYDVVDALLPAAAQ